MDMAIKVARMRLILLGYLLLAAICGIGQSNQSKPPFIPQARDRFVMDLHNDFLMRAPENLNVRPWSPGFNAALMFDYPIQKSFFSIAFGVGFSSFNLHTKGFFYRTYDNKIQFIELPTTTYEKNKLSVNFVEVPVELRIRTKSESPFKIYLGGTIGYAVNTHTKIIDIDGKRKFFDIWGLEKLRYCGTVRVGKGRIAAYGFFSFSPLFRLENAPLWNPSGIGLSFYLI
jgi:hypothetical protein